ncbi:hypothetical protein PINS_up003385 [Pythium insidiosum]|nr:hypothetical protein PINS_up003385 [Pythium insidiosum]
MTRALERLTSTSLAHLGVRHCSNLTFTSHLARTSTRQLSLKLYNVSIDAWPQHAALTAATHPRLCVVYFIRTTFPQNELPAGLLSPSFPPLLVDIEFSYTNLRTLPGDLHTRWPPGIVLYLEYSELDRFPSTLLKMQVFQLMTAGNPITSVPPELLSLPTLNALQLSRTRISGLPDIAVKPSALKSLRRISMIETNVSALPTWMDEAFLKRVVVTAPATPLCDAILRDTNRTGILRERPSLHYVVCKNTPIRSYPQDVELRAEESSW